MESLAATVATDRASGRESIERRCSRLGLPPPDGEVLDFPLFGSASRLDLSSLDLTDTEGEERSQTDRILFYHYFASEAILAVPAPRETELVSFRDFPGGAFYWEPFRSRTCLPLAKRFGSDLRGLRAALGRFDWEELKLGDFGARIRGFGGLFLTLVAYAAEEGIEAEINVLFDPAMRRVYGAEDAAAFASRICLSLL